MMTKFWTVLCLCVVGVIADTNVKNHNEHEHEALCNLLKIAVHEWNNLKSRGSAGTLKKALERTLFGKEDGGEMGDLKGGLPKDYEKVQGELSLRLTWCGIPKESKTGKEKPRWPGHSAPHDLLCLCTTGQGRYPFNDARRDSGTSTKLCGKPKEDLGGDIGGWASSGGGIQQINATWVNITQKCLEGNVNVKGLSDALEDFLGKLGKKDPEGEYNDRYQLGEGQSNDEYPCSGYEKICVMYYNTTGASYPMPWWSSLKEAIKTEEKSYEHKKKQEEEKRNKKEKNQQKARLQDKSQPKHSPSTAALRSANPDKQEDELENTQNISAPLATIEDTSNTQLFSPCPWLLSAYFLI